MPAHPQRQGRNRTGSAGSDAQKRLHFNSQALASDQGPSTSTLLTLHHSSQLSAQPPYTHKHTQHTHARTHAHMPRRRRRAKKASGNKDTFILFLSYRVKWVNMQWVSTNTFLKHPLARYEKDKDENKNSLIFVRHGRTEAASEGRIVARRSTPGPLAVSCQDF